MSTDKYLSLIISQHKQKPKFNEVVKASIEPIIDCGNLLKALNSYFDIDTATGDQLQIIADWVGAQNAIPNAIPIPFFGFADQPESLPAAEQDGTDFGGYWRESGMSDHRALAMSEQLFKRVVKAKIKLNNSDCTLSSAKEILETVLDQSFKIKDNDDMTVTFSFSTAYEVWQRELVKLLFPLPSGVRLIFEGEDEY